MSGPEAPADPGWALRQHLFGVSSHSDVVGGEQMINAFCGMVFLRL